MALINGEEESSAPPSTSELLLYATYCMVGLPVDVKVKDGSIYSGIFYTACFDKDRGIVLKRARKIHEGKCLSNIALGDCVDTLVVHSSLVVHIVVKEHLIPAEGTVGNLGNSAKLVSEIESEICSRNLESGGEDTKCGDISELREVTRHEPEGEKNADTIGEVLEVQRLTPSREPCSISRKDANPNGAGSISTEDIHLVSPESKDPSSTEFALPDAKTSAYAACTILDSDIKATSGSSISALPDLSIPEKNAGSDIAQSSKLNPRAKIFTPSVTSLGPLPSVMTNQMPNNLPTVPVGGAQLGTEVNYVRNHFSVPGKLLAQNNPTAAQIGSNESAMTGQPAYGHPQGAIQQAYVLPLGQPYVLPLGQPYGLLNHVNAPKFQGIIGHSNTPLPLTPFITFDGNQTYVSPSVMLLLPSISLNPPSL